MKLETVKEVLIRRDGMSSEDAEDYIQSVVGELQGIIQDDDGNYWAAEEAFCSEFGLEPDYFMDFCYTYLR